MTSLLISLSLALGILVSDLSGYKLLTSAHAQADSCGSRGGGSTATGSIVLINSGVAVRDIVVNGQLVEQAVIAGSVLIVNGVFGNSSGVIVGGGGGNPGTSGVIVGGGGAPTTSGVIVGGGASGDGVGKTGSPCLNGVIVGGGGAPTTSGVIVGGGGGAPTTSGVIVGGGGAPDEGDGEGYSSADDVVVSASRTFVGGTLTGDGISINDGVITGQNLLLIGASTNGSAGVTPGN